MTKSCGPKQGGCGCDKCNHAEAKERAMAYQSQKK